jgi:integrase
MDCAVSLKGYIPYIKDPKTATSYRTIPMHSLIAEILSNFEKPKDNAQTVFCNTLGGIWEPHIFYKQYVGFFAAINKDASEDQTVNYRPSHACRHTFATNLNRAGGDPKTISELLGHAHTDITFDDVRVRCLCLHRYVLYIQNAMCSPF